MGVVVFIVGSFLWFILDGKWVIYEKFYEMFEGVGCVWGILIYL